MPIDLGPINKPTNNTKAGSIALIVIGVVLVIISKIVHPSPEIQAATKEKVDAVMRIKQ
jgi:hypothetical protein